MTGQLATAVAAQQTAQARTAAAAVARAPKATATRSGPVTTIPASPGPGSPPPTTVPAGNGVGTSNGNPYPNLSDPALNPFLTCVIQAESGGNYGIVSPNGLYMGAFQFSQPTWNSAASGVM